MRRCKPQRRISQQLTIVAILAIEAVAPSIVPAIIGDSAIAERLKHQPVGNALLFLGEGGIKRLQGADHAIELGAPIRQSVLTALEPFDDAWRALTAASSAPAIATSVLGLVLQDGGECRPGTFLRRRALQSRVKECQPPIESGALITAAAIAEIRAASELAIIGAAILWILLLLVLKIG